MFVLHILYVWQWFRLPLWEFSVKRIFCGVAKALCMMTKARSVGHNEENGEGMLSPLDRNVSPCPGHKAQFNPGPRREKNMPFWNTRWRIVWAVHYITVARLSAGLFKTGICTEWWLQMKTLCSYQKQWITHTHLQSSFVHNYV